MLMTARYDILHEGFDEAHVNAVQWPTRMPRTVPQRLKTQHTPWGSYIHRFHTADVPRRTEEIERA